MCYLDVNSSNYQACEYTSVAFYMTAPLLDVERRRETPIWAVSNHSELAHDLLTTSGTSPLTVKTLPNDAADGSSILPSLSKTYLVEKTRSCLQPNDPYYHQCGDVVITRENYMMDGIVLQWSIPQPATNMQHSITDHCLGSLQFL